MGKWGTGLLYLLSGGRIGSGWLYDFWTLNAQISERNQSNRTGAGQRIGSNGVRSILLTIAASASS